MTRLGLLLAAGALLRRDALVRADRRHLRARRRRQPAAAGVGPVRPRQRPGAAADKPKIAEAAKTAKDRQVTSICLVGHTDKLGDKALNAKLARERSQAVAAELIQCGLSRPIDIVIAADPEAFGNMSLGSSDASEKDRRVTILFSR